jgi:3',5'-cyclic AMP phosphodiesterase CpdA
MPGSWRALFDKRVLGCANHLLRRRRRFRADRLRRAIARLGTLSPDWIVVTGDLTTTGEPAEFAAALAALKPLKAIALRGVVYVPGNHDAYVRDRLCREALDRACRTLNDGPGLADLPREITDRGLRMFLLDETLPTAPWLSSGRLGERNGDWLRERLTASRADGEARIVVGHFPLRRADGTELSRRRRLVDGDVLRSLGRDGAFDVALCGHIHEAYRRDRDKVMEVCAGSLTLEGRLNVLDFFPDSCTFSQFWLDMSDEEATPVLAGGQVPAAGAH